MDISSLILLIQQAGGVYTTGDPNAVATALNNPLYFGALFASTYDANNNPIYEITQAGVDPNTISSGAGATTNIPVGTALTFIIGVGPGTINPLSKLFSIYGPYFTRFGLTLNNIDTSNWTGILGGAFTVSATTALPFETLADANQAAMNALTAAGFSVKGHTNVPMGQAIPGYPANQNLAPQDQSPDLGLSSLSPFSLGLGSGALLVGLVIAAVLVFGKR